MARVYALSTFYKDKGSGYFDKDYKGWYNIGIDEFQPEKGERKAEYTLNRRCFWKARSPILF